MSRFIINHVPDEHGPFIIVSTDNEDCNHDLDGPEDEPMLHIAFTSICTGKNLRERKAETYLTADQALLLAHALIDSAHELEALEPVEYLS